MKSFEKLKTSIDNQLHASIPNCYKSSYEESTFYLNINRFSAQCFILVPMDFITLAVYIFYLYLAFDNIHISTIISFTIKISLMIVLFLYFSFISEKKYKKNNIIFKNIDIIFPMLHGLLELLIFLAGPRDFASFLRFLTVPFIVGVVPVFNQKKAFFVLIITYLIQAYIILNFYSGYILQSETPIFFVNIWFLCFVCAFLISNLSYSANVNNYVLQMKEFDIKRELIRANLKLDKITKRDQLTGLSNRLYFDEYIKSNWDKAFIKDQDISILLFDIDYFKKYNDRFGHVIGDECLIQISAAIRKKIKNIENVFARIGGEEFAIAFFNLDHNMLVSLAEEIRETIENLKIEDPLNKVSPYATISVGLATAKVTSLIDKNTIISWADECLYYAKQNGRNKVIHTMYERKKFMNINNELMPNKESIGEKNNFSELINIKEIEEVLKLKNSDCTFSYIKDLNIFEFSELAVELFNVPNSVSNPYPEKLLAYVVGENFDYLNKYLLKILENKETSFSFETLIKLYDNKKVHSLIKGNCIYNENNNLQAIFGSIVNIEDIIIYHDFIKKDNIVKSITDLPSRKKFYNDITKILNNKESYGHIILFDIVDFKSINNIYSHDIGDKVLIKATEMLKKIISPYGNLYNYALDQFISIIPSTEHLKTKNIMQEISDFFNSQCIYIGEMKIKIIFSIGAIFYNGNGSSLEELLKGLDITIQKSKSNDVFAFFEEKDRIEFLAKTSIERQLKESVEENFFGFFLQYQPIFTSIENKCVGAEALLRFKTKDDIVISPIFMIPLLEKTGIMSKVEVWIFNEACKQCKYWIDNGARSDFFIQVNLSIVQMARPTLIEEVINACEKNNLDKNNLRLEVTESSIILDKKIIETLNFLRQTGIKIAVDDFGTGFSSLSYLKSLPIDEIKIDKSFLIDIENDKISKDLLNSIIDLTKSMGYLVCIEGVETDEQKNILEKSKSDYFQGFLFSKPIHPEKFYSEFIKNSEFKKNII